MPPDEMYHLRQIDPASSLPPAVRSSVALSLPDSNRALLRSLASCADESSDWDRSTRKKKEAPESESSSAPDLTRQFTRSARAHVARHDFGTQSQSCETEAVRNREQLRFDRDLAPSRLQRSHNAENLPPLLFPQRDIYNLLATRRILREIEFVLDLCFAKWGFFFGSPRSEPPRSYISFMYRYEDEKE